MGIEARHAHRASAPAAAVGWLILALAGCSPGRTQAAKTEAPANLPSEALGESDRTSQRADSPTTNASRMDLKDKLTALQYDVTQCSATEPPFANAYWDNHEPGLYLDVVSGTPLFSSEDKFDSGTGWPSFTRPVEPEAVSSRQDKSHGMARIEARSSDADSHLGHIFDDGPSPTGLRYCINSAALRFVHVRDLEREGLGKYLSLFSAETLAKAGVAKETTSSPSVASAPLTKTLVLAGGCFWGMQDILRKQHGVVDTDVGYTGGWLENPRYDDTHDSKSGHAEAVRIEFDPKETSYAVLLDLFFRMHDPTTKDRQGNDRGTQYRSAIFYADEEQKREAEAAIQRAQASGRWKKPIVTTLEPFQKWWPAETYHQDYLQKHPGGYTCHFLRD